MNSHSLFCATLTLMVGCIFASSASAVVWDVFPKDVRTVGIVSVSDSYLLDFKMNMAITSDDTLVKASDELGPET